MAKDYFNFSTPGGSRSATPSISFEAHEMRSSSRTQGRVTPSTPGRMSIHSTMSGVSTGVGTGKTIRQELMVRHLFQQQCVRRWLYQTNGNLEGVLVRKQRGFYFACPPALEYSDLAQGIRELNVEVALTIKSGLVHTFLDWAKEEVDVPLKSGQRIQILPTALDLAKARKHQYAAFIAKEEVLVVWDDDAINILNRASQIEQDLMEVVWTAESPAEDDEKRQAVVEDNVESQIAERPRATMLYSTILTSCMLVLVCASCGAGFRQLSQQIAIDKNFMRLAFLLFTPIQAFFTLFFAQVVVGLFAQVIGPVQQLHTNTKYFSAIAPPRGEINYLPHVTIQCPVYNEGLKSVIALTVKSLKKAISTYELQGGTANIFVNDDGIQAGKLTPDEIQERIDFYTDNNIGWTARPAHGLDGFVRRGKFKKASNMNYGLYLSNCIEEKLAKVKRNEFWNQDQEMKEYERCREEVKADLGGKALIGGNIRIGDYILLVDSDTEVPSDCLLDAATEMEQCPNVGIMQFSSGVMKVVDNYFVNGITFFTNLIYTYIRYGVANGDVAPFVGHNAILRWSAVQQVSYVDEDKYEKYWSESHVSEDFDMALRLQIEGYVIRLAAWANDEFKEGVSLTVYDELARWEKYAYGCNELLFRPIRQWYKGPFTPLFLKFAFADVRFSYKVTVMAYIGTYYAIGAAWILTLLNYFLFGWFNGHVDHYMIDSWQVWFSLVVIFSFLGNVVLAVLRYRLGEKGFFSALFENAKWILLMAIFFGGLSLHVSQAIFFHAFSIDMSWGATGKEAEFSNFFIEVPKVLKKFKFTFIFCFLLIAGMIILAVAPFVPYYWRITNLIAIAPLGILVGSHLLLPIALNPALMTFSW